MSLSGKVALITGEPCDQLLRTKIWIRGLSSLSTGAGSGLGNHLARALRARGATIIIGDINETAGKNAAEEFNKLQKG